MALPQMEVVGLHTSISLYRETWRSHYLHRFQFTTLGKKSFLHGCSFQFRARSRSRELVSPRTNLSIIRRVNATERVEEDFDVIDNPAAVSTMSSSEDEESSASTFLSLSEKPDRNMALLDDYELEELDFASNPNHRSGTYSFLSSSFSFFSVKLFVALSLIVEKTQEKEKQMQHFQSIVSCMNRSCLIVLNDRE